MKPIAILLGIALVPTASACARSDDPPPSAEKGTIDFVRNSEFAGPKLRVFLTLVDGAEVSVNTADDEALVVVGDHQLDAAQPAPGPQPASSASLSGLYSGRRDDVVADMA